MTERRAPRRSPRSALYAWSGSVLAFLAVLGALSWQVAAGRDPAIGAGPQAAAAPTAEQVLVRRIVRRVIVTRDGGSGGTAPAAPAAATAPAPVPAPAPAPAPAPPTTRAS